MKLYSATKRPTLVENGVVAACPERICQVLGFTHPHLCLESAPSAGRGPHVHVFDFPDESLKEYEYVNDFSKVARTVYAVPHNLIISTKSQCQEYAEMVGREWDTSNITLLRRDAVKPSTGQWALVWLSRPGIASAEIESKTETPDGVPSFLSISLRLSDTFNPERDYVIIEEHEEGVATSGKPRETWKLFTWAGVTPSWVIYPSLWQHWVNDTEVLDSAIQYIMEHIPQAIPDIEFARTRASKDNIIRAWRQVAERASYTLTRKLGKQVDLGTFAQQSWTAVAAMPMRIARRIGQHLSKTPWLPPWPQPEYEDPNKSGRVLLANSYGIFPKEGPGIDPVSPRRIYNKEEKALRSVPVVSTVKSTEHILPSSVDAMHITASPSSSTSLTETDMPVTDSKNEEVHALVDPYLKKGKVKSSEIFDAIKDKLPNDVQKLSVQQFHARFILPTLARRRRNSRGYQVPKRKGTKTTKAARKTTGVRGTRRLTGSLMERMDLVSDTRKQLIKFADDVIAANGDPSQIIRAADELALDLSTKMA